MATQDELPAWLTDALDKPLVGPVALIVLGCLFVLAAAAALDAWTDRHFDRIERETQTGKYRPPSEAEFESAAAHWHRPPVQTWGDEPREVRK